MLKIATRQLRDLKEAYHALGGALWSSEIEDVSYGNDTRR